jgi:hypothetical protein
LLKKNIIVFDTIHKFEKNKIMSHDNHSHDNHEQGSEYTFFDGGPLSPPLSPPPATPLAKATSSGSAGA